jgi:hypothetical protein
MIVRLIEARPQRHCGKRRICPALFLAEPRSACTANIRSPTAPTICSRGRGFSLVDDIGGGALEPKQMLLISINATLTDSADN